MSKTNNSKVLELYSFIKRKENVDTDYWWLGIGVDRIICYFEDFSEVDWRDLEKDLSNWSDGQLEIFTYCIMNGFTYSANELEKRTEQFGKDNKWVSESIYHRFELITPLISIAKERSRFQNDIHLTLIENFHFVEIHFDLLAKGIENFIPKLEKVMELLHRNYILYNYPSIKSKLEAI